MTHWNQKITNLLWKAIDDNHETINKLRIKKEEIKQTIQEINQEIENLQNDNHEIQQQILKIIQPKN